MHPQQVENLLFRGIPPRENRGLGKLAASICLHAVVIGLLAFVTPAILVNRPSNLRLDAPLIAPPQVAAVPQPPARVAVVTPPPEAVVTRQFVAPHETRPAAPKLEAAPDLVKARRPELVLPAPLPVEPIQPPVQTGVFGSNAPTRANPVLPIPPARSAGFDSSMSQRAAPLLNSTRVGAFETHTSESGQSLANARVQTGEFAAARSERAARVSAGSISHAGFDVQVEKSQATSADSAIRKTGFDEVKTGAAPVRAAAPAAAATRPVEIIEKPRPAYTAEARAQKIEGDVLLDVIFTAAGEVRVLDVRRGLGHGLDQNAIDAARRIRFHPATEDGKPVDQRAVLHIIFQITG